MQILHCCGQKYIIWNMDDQISNGNEKQDQYK